MAKSLAVFHQISQMKFCPLHIIHSLFTYWALHTTNFIFCFFKLILSRFPYLCYPSYLATIIVSLCSVAAKELIFILLSICFPKLLGSIPMEEDEHAYYGGGVL